MDYFKLNPKLKDKILNPFWTPPPDAKTPKGGRKGEHGIWQEPVQIEDFAHEKDAETLDEVVRIRVRVTGETITENQGKSHTEFLHFPAEALQDGGADGKVQQFSISYRNLIAAYHACGNEGTPDPGEIDPDCMRAGRVTVTVRLAPDKMGQTRMNVSGWTI